MKSLWFCSLLLLFGGSTAFVIAPSSTAWKQTPLSDATTDEPTTSTLDAKQVVKLFGRLAEKYIMLDDSGGQCCYSGCSDCEFRLPGGGYKMADQSSSRPKWIPVYDNRNFETLGKSHESKWSQVIYADRVVVNEQEFVEALRDMEFVTPLGGPYLSKSAGEQLETEAALALWQLLATGKEKLTKHSMSKRLQELAGGEQGVTWAMMEEALLK